MALSYESSCRFNPADLAENVPGTITDGDQGPKLVNVQSGTYYGAPAEYRVTAGLTGEPRKVLVTISGDQEYTMVDTDKLDHLPASTRDRHVGQVLRMFEVTR